MVQNKLEILRSRWLIKKQDFALCPSNLKLLGVIIFSLF